MLTFGTEKDLSRLEQVFLLWKRVFLFRRVFVAHLQTPPVAMTVAGSDSGGGAGIQADLRTFAFHRVHGTSALTCITAQNTCGVTRVDALPPEAVLAQMTAVIDDIGVQSAKLGMLLNAEIMEAVAAAIARHNVPSWVIDPVMVSRTGAQLIDDGAPIATRPKFSVVRNSTAWLIWRQRPAKFSILVPRRYWSKAAA